MIKDIKRAKRPKIYVFAGEKENPDWYYTECEISQIYIDWKKPYCVFICKVTDFVGTYIHLTLKQMLILPRKQRLYYSEKKAKKRQNLNWQKKETAGDNNA